MNDINLLPTHRVQRLARRQHTLAWVVGASIYTAVVVLGAAGTYAGTGPSRAAAQKEREEIERSIETGKGEIAQLNQRLADARHRLKTSVEVSKHPDWSILLKLLADLRDSRMVLDKVELNKVTIEAPGAKAAQAKKKPVPASRQKFVLKLSGIAQSLDTVPPFVLRLEGIGLFSSVKLLESRTGELQGRPMAMFRIECALADSEDAAP